MLSSSAASSSSRFDTLEKRPPTPPRDVNGHFQSAADFLEHGYDDDNDQDDNRTMRTVVSTDTPPASSPTVPPQNPHTGQAASKKVVGFSPVTTYHDVPRLGISSSPGDRIRRSQPRSKSSANPKSILKRSIISPLPTPDEADLQTSYFSAEGISSISKMLPSMLQALASEVRSSKLDAYMTLLGAFKACEDVPDRLSMAAKIGQFQQYISRDMTSKGSDGKPDTQLATQAMNLVFLILHEDSLAKALDDNFRAFLVEESISVLEQPNMPKAMFKAHLFLLAHQQFNHSVMTDGRTNRILSLLRTVEERCTGNSPAAGRIVIYQRLLEQNPILMNAKARDWLEHVFHGMLSSSKDLRGRSIEACTYAGTVLGTKPATYRALQQLFETRIADEQDYFDYFRTQLVDMVKVEDTSAYVPRIWSAVILFFRSKQKLLESWSRLNSWLKLLQLCLNSSDTTVKYHANLAWHRFVYVVMPDSSTSKQMRSMLKVPIITALAKPAKERQNRYSRQMAMDNYDNLLHYALRPSLGHADLDIAWDEFAEPVLLEMATAGAGGRRFACKVLHGLFTPSAGAWNEKAALEADLIKPEDLPRLDARWVRSRLAKVLKVVEPLLIGLLRSSEGCAAALSMWQEILQTIADAGAQEVRTSNELREAIALTMNLFRRLWKPCSSTESQPQTLDIRLSTFRELLLKTCQYVGPSLLSEDILAKTPQGDAQAAPTPSHRASKHQYALQSPLVFIAVMFCHTDTSEESVAWQKVVRQILEVACEVKTTSAAKVHLLAKTLQTLFTACSEGKAGQRAQSLWPLFVALTSEALMLSHIETGANGSLGQQLRDAVSVLVRGVSASDIATESGAVALSLVKEMIRAAKSHAGDAGVVLAVSEPLAKYLTEKGSAAQSTATLACSSALLRSAPWPQTRQVMDQARKMLWGTAVGSSRTGGFDPYEHVYRLIAEASEYAYSLCAIDSRDQEHALAYLDALRCFFAACPESAALNALRHAQAGAIIWLEDHDRLVSTNNQPIHSRAVALWSVCLGLLGNLLQKDPALLHSLHPLFVAAFSSPDRTIVNNTIVSWNTTFSETEILLYPSKLEQILQALQPHVELHLPSFPKTTQGLIDVVLPAFEPSQEDATASFSSRWSGLPRGTASPAKAIGPSLHDKSSQLHTLDTVSSTKTASAASTKPTPKARLRHDNSQMEFAPIESSPLRHELDSQLLTDRQKEVKERQEQDAQMFPDLSSSPAKPKQTTRRLDFAPHLSEIGGREALGTPLELPDGHAEMSDYLGSSPTPHSSDKTPVRNREADTADDEDQPEPPSSPPQSPTMKSSFVADSAEQERDTNEDYMTAQQSNVASHLEISNRSVLAESDLPSDTVLPAEQLQHEAEIAVERTHVENDDDAGHVVDVDATTVIDATELRDLGKEDDGSAAPIITAENDQPGADDLEASRVENSFIESESAMEPVEPLEAASQDSTRSSTRKRKRGSVATSISASKRRKAQSPLKRVVSGISGFLGMNRNVDDETEDEIVVASSQPTSSPASKRHEQLDVELEPKASSQPTTTVKRGRGRPKKSETPTPAVPATAAASTRKLKRKASNLSNTSTTDLDPTAIKETPAPAKARKQRKSRNGSAVHEPSEQDADDVRPPSRRVATEVAIEPSDTPVSLSRTRMADSDEEGNAITPEKQLQDEIATSSRDRPTATPRGILARLRDVLADYGKMILGPQEEREHDDVLFALRTEMHEAGRRGRQG